VTSGDVLSIDELWLSKETSRPYSPVETQGTVGGAGELRTERELIERALAETRGRISGSSGAAARLRISPSTLTTGIMALKINRSQFKYLG
jgi:hypothetical protein